MTQFLVSGSGARALVILSICYGLVIAVLGVYAPSAIGPFALVGALLLGLLWTVRALLSRDADRR